MHKEGIMQNAAAYFSAALKEAADPRSQHAEDNSSCSSCWKDLRRSFISGISSRQGQKQIHILLPRAFFELYYGDLRILFGCLVPCVVILTVNILTSIQNLSLSIYDDCLLFSCHVLHEKLPWPLHRYCGAVVSLKLSLLQAEQVQLLQPFLTGQMLQSPDHPGGLYWTHSTFSVAFLNWGPTTIPRCSPKIAKERQGLVISNLSLLAVPMLAEPNMLLAFTAVRNHH